MFKNTLALLSAPLSINLEITDKCNFKCSFCFNDSPAYAKLMLQANRHGNGEKIESDTPQIARKKRLLKIIDKLAAAEVFEIRFFGGEFTTFKYWREVMEYSANQKFFISFVSNGYLITREDIEFFIKCGVCSCTISIHGPEKLHDMIVKQPGSFKKTVYNVKLLLESGVRVSIAYTPIKENINAIYKFVNSFKMETGVQDFSISRLFNDNRYENLTIKDYHEILKTVYRCHKEIGVNIFLADSFPRCRASLKYWPYLSYCSQGVAFGQVDFEGNLKHCSATSKPLGNILHEPITTLWKRGLKEMRSLDHLPSSCKICPIFCGGGCTVSRGIDHKFSPDQFILQPEEESLMWLVVKTIYNYTRKMLFSAKKMFIINRITTKSIRDLPAKPFLQEQYRIRHEEGKFIAMFEKTGIKTLSYLGLMVLKNIDGTKTVQQIVEKCNSDGYPCSNEDVMLIIREIL